MSPLERGSNHGLAYQTGDGPATAAVAATVAATTSIRYTADVSTAAAGWLDG